MQYPRNTTEFTSSLHVGLACIEIYGRCDGSWTKKTEPKWNHFYIIQFILSEAPGGWHKEFPVTFDDGPSQIISIILDRVQISWMRHDYYFHNAWCVIFLLDFHDWWISLGWDLFCIAIKLMWYVMANFFFSTMREGLKKSAWCMICTFPHGCLCHRVQVQAIIVNNYLLKVVLHWYTVCNNSN